MSLERISMVSRYSNQLMDGDYDSIDDNVLIAARLKPLFTTIEVDNYDEAGLELVR